MKLEEQVVSLELAKKLKELGVPQESIFYWNERAGIADFYNHFIPTDREIAAYTVAELGEMLPFEICPVGRLHVDGNLQDGQWYMWVYPSAHSKKASTEADARAKMLIYLIENGLHDPQK